MLELSNVVNWIALDEGWKGSFERVMSTSFIKGMTDIFLYFAACIAAHWQQLIFKLIHEKFQFFMKTDRYEKSMIAFWWINFAMAVP